MFHNVNDHSIPAEGVERLSARRIAAAKTSFSTRRVTLSEAACLVTNKAPQSGDLVMAEVTSIGHHQCLENPHGRRCALHVGDKIIVAYGARYAPDQFDGVVPRDLGPCHLLAAGGIAGQVVSRHSATRPATALKPIGLLADSEMSVLNVRRFRLITPKSPSNSPVVIAVVGTSMNSGKTRAASSLIRGLTLAGLNVAAAKLTGTGSGGDVWSMVDYGAKRVVDFTDAGFATTHQADARELKSASLLLLDDLSTGEHDVIVVEIADGLLQRETALLLEAPEVRERIHAILFAASDSMGALAGVDWLKKRDLPLVGLAGMMTASPLASEEAQAATGLAAYTSEELSDPELAPKLCFSADDNVRANLRRCA